MYIYAILIIMSSNSQLPTWVGYAPNHEMKPAVMFGLLSAGKAVTQTGLANEINSLQAGLVGFSTASPQQFCEQSLQPAGFSEQTTVEYMKLGVCPTSARGDRLTDLGLERGIALGGDIAAWSLRNPDFTLAEVLGHTFPKRTEQGVSHGELRYQILSNLAIHGRLAVTELTELSSDYSGTSAAVKEMETEGILVVGRSHVTNSRTFEIINPEYVVGERKRPFEKLVPERQFMFRTLRIANKLRSTWQLDEFLDLAEAVENDPELLQKLSNLIQHLLAPSIEGTQHNIRNVSGPLYNDGDKYTGVKIADKVKPAVEELVGIVSSHIAEEPAAILGGTDNALRIMESPEDMAELIAKPRRRSSLVIKDPDFGDRLTDIVNDASGPLDAKAIHDAYEKMAERKVGVHTITIRLWDLVKSGAVNAQVRPRIIGKTQAAPLYYTV